MIVKITFKDGESQDVEMDGYDIDTLHQIVEKKRFIRVSMVGEGHECLVNLEDVSGLIPLKDDE